MENQSTTPSFKTMFGFVAAMLLVGCSYALVSGLADGLPVAYAVLGGLVFLVVAGLGGTVVLFVQWIDEAKDARRARREQERFAANANENLQIMAMTAKAQATQGLALQRQAQAARQLMPAGEPPGMIDFDPAMFIEGEVE